MQHLIRSNLIKNQLLNLGFFYMGRRKCVVICAEVYHVKKNTY